VNSGRAGVERGEIFGGDPVLEDVPAADLVNLIPVQERLADVEPGHIEKLTAYSIAARHQLVAA
jgi:hypothetical protein